MACQRKAGSVANHQRDGTIDLRRDGALGVLPSSPRGNGFNRNKSETDSEGESQTFDDGARTHEENKTFLAMPEWNSFARTSSRALASKLCEIFATLGIFLNRTAIQH